MRAGGGRRDGARGTGLIQLLLVLLVIASLTWLALKMYQRSAPAKVAPGGGHPARAVLDRVEFRIEGMSTELDALQVSEALRRVPGVAAVSVDFRTGQADVTFHPQRTGPEELLAAVRRAGFRARR